MLAQIAKPNIVLVYQMPLEITLLYALVLTNTLLVFNNTQYALKINTALLYFAMLMSNLELVIVVMPPMFIQLVIWILLIVILAIPTNVFSNTLLEIALVLTPWNVLIQMLLSTALYLTIVKTQPKDINVLNNLKPNSQEILAPHPAIVLIIFLVLEEYVKELLLDLNAMMVIVLLDLYVIPITERVCLQLHLEVLVLKIPVDALKNSLVDMHHQIQANVFQSSLSLLDNHAI
jgi:hypothetical protein